MQVRFQRANHRTGNESLVLKFDGVVDGQTACILVDSGNGVDVDSLLGDGEYLACVLLTHAHRNHVRTLGDNVRDGAPVFAAAPTAAVLSAALDDPECADVVVESATAAMASLERLTAWRSVLGDGAVRVCPVPAGHAPGAAGFVVQFRDGDVARNLLVTGDFTKTAAGGYPGLPTRLPVDVEAMVLNVPTSDDFETTLTDVVETTLSATSKGFRTLLTANPLSGVHLARILDAASDHFGLDVTVRVLGAAARTYAPLGFPSSGVELYPDAVDPAAVLAPGDVTIATPETPIGGDAKPLFDAIKDDEEAALVQVTRSATGGVTGAVCSTSAFEVRPHPTEAHVDDVVDAYDPLHVVVGGESGAELDAYKDKYAAFVWANQDRLEQTLFDDGEWQAPPWVSDRAERYVYGNTNERGGNALDERADPLDVSLPAVESGQVTLHAEGLDVSRLEDRFGESVTVAPDDARQADVDDATLADVLDRLDRIEGTLAATAGERVPVTVVRDGDDTLLRLSDDVDVEDGGDVIVYLSREAE